MLIHGRYQGNGFTFALGTGSTPYAVYVILGVTRHIVIDHQINAVHVNAAADYVGGNDDVNFAVFERQHGFFTLVLFHVATHLTYREVLALQLAVQGTHRSFRRAEHHNPLTSAVFEQVGDQGQFLLFIHHISSLGNSLGGFGKGNTDRDRLAVHQRPRQFHHAIGHGG